MDDKDRNAKIMDAKGLGVSEVCAIAFFYRLLPPPRFQSRFGHGKSGAFS